MSKKHVVNQSSFYVIVYKKELYVQYCSIDPWVWITEYLDKAFRFSLKDAKEYIKYMKQYIDKKEFSIQKISIKTIKTGT